MAVDPNSTPAQSAQFAWELDMERELEQQLGLTRAAFSAQIIEHSGV